MCWLEGYDDFIQEEDAPFIHRTIAALAISIVYDVSYYIGDMNNRKKEPTYGKQDLVKLLFGLPSSKHAMKNPS